jgi:hypothetical protein
MSEENSIDYLLHNIYNRLDNVVTDFPKFRVVQNVVNNRFLIVSNISDTEQYNPKIFNDRGGPKVFYNVKENDDEGIIIVISLNSISIKTNKCEIKFEDGKSIPWIDRNNLFDIKKRVLINNTVLYTVYHKEVKIAEVNFLHKILLNSTYFDNIYLENIRSIDEQYQKLRVYPEDVIVDIDGNINKSDVISFIFTKNIISKTVTDNYLNQYYLIQMNHYFDGSYAKQFYIYLKFLNKKAIIVKTNIIEDIDTIVNNISNENKDIVKESFLGKRAYNSYIPLRKIKYI